MRLWRVRLRGERDVEEAASGWCATSPEPWLALDVPDAAALAGRLVEITYRASAWDEPAHPLIRCHLADGGGVDQLAPAPWAGAGIWIGRVPRGTLRLSVSPTTRVGPFGFRVESIRTRAWTALLRHGVSRNRRSTRSAVLTRLIGWAPESDVNLAWAIGADPIADYDAWTARRHRPLEIDGIDAPRFDWERGPLIRVHVLAGAAADVERTLDGLRAQSYPRWLAVVAGPSSPDDPRIVGAAEAGQLPEASSELLTFVLAAGDRLLPHALAYVAERARRQPDARLFVGDRLCRADDGTAQPIFEPGWSPRLRQAVPLDAPLFVRDLGSLDEATRRAFLATGRLPPAWLGGLDASKAVALRRVVVETRTPASRPAAIARPAPPPGRRAAIIIPTRDQPALLRRVVGSLRAHGRPVADEIIVVDNGSTIPEAKAALRELAAAPDVVVLERAGPFNFSALCNAAAAASEAEVLVFLNDDTVVLHAGWLDRLSGHAADPGIGAVGARLTYPDGRIQHVGVVVGLGGSAGHFGALDGADAPGWAARNLALHEVSAVTGACLAVERRKFEAVGGFDAEHLPVELSDIDLCLKLNARGWQTVVDPAVHLMHEESVSRGGATFRRLQLYADQRAIFLDRWRHVLRDDPFFHPALSLYSLHPALG